RARPAGRPLGGAAARPAGPGRARAAAWGVARAARDPFRARRVRAVPAGRARHDAVAHGLFQRARANAMSPPRVSVAVPLYNEEHGLPELLRRLRAVLDGLPGGPHEMVFANDGSADRTLELLEEAAREDERVVVVSLSRNFGPQAALTAAPDHLSGARRSWSDAGRATTACTPCGRSEPSRGGCGSVTSCSIARWRGWRRSACRSTQGISG